MDAIKHLKELGAKPKTRRSTTLIVPKVSFSRDSQSLNNDDWAFHVGYGFRDALDIKLQERVKDKKRIMVWTQGPIISFKEGDLIHSKDDKMSVQVITGTPSAWYADKDTFDQGSVSFTVRGIEELKGIPKSLSQYEFLQFLIDGNPSHLFA